MRQLEEDRRARYVSSFSQRLCYFLSDPGYTSVVFVNCLMVCCGDGVITLCRILEGQCKHTLLFYFRQLKEEQKRKERELKNLQMLEVSNHPGRNAAKKLVVAQGVNHLG